MGLLEDRILRIIELKEQGLDNRAVTEKLELDETTVDRYYNSTRETLSIFEYSGKNLEEIAAQVGFSPISVNFLLNHYNINIMSKREITKMARKKPSRLPYVDRINQIIDLAGKGSSVTEIADETGLLESTIRTYASREKTKLSYSERITREKRIEQIKQAIANGAQFIEDVADKIGTKPISLYRNYKKDINLPPFKDQKNRHSAKKDPLKDELIRKGLTLEEIAEKYSQITSKRKITRDGIRKYIVGTGQHEIWEQAKEERKNEYGEKKHVLAGLSSQLENIGSCLVSQIELAGLKNASEEERIAYEKTQEYINSKKWTTYSFNQIFSLFQDYYTALSNNEKVSIMKLGENNNVYFTTVGRILRDVGLKPLIRVSTKERVATPKYKKRVLERAVEVEMPSIDIAYFLRAPSYTVQFFSYHYKGNKIRPQVKQFIKRFGSKSSILNYKTASEIYEARDLGFSREETLELLEVDNKVYRYAIRHRKEISQHIMNSLHIMFPDKEVTKPYVN